VRIVIVAQIMSIFIPYLENNGIFINGCSTASPDKRCLVVITASRLDPAFDRIEIVILGIFFVLSQFVGHQQCEISRMIIRTRGIKKNSGSNSSAVVGRWPPQVGDTPKREEVEER
jgi:hypothetical protein